MEGALDECVLWLADREELCEQAVQSWREVWKTRGPAEPLRISRLWGSTNDRVEDVQERNHVVVATFQSLVRRVEQTKFDWLTRAACVVIDEAHGSVTPSYTTILNQLGLTPRETPIPLIGLTATPFRGGAEDGSAETTRLVRRYGGRRFDHGVFSEDGSYPRLRRMGVLSDAEFARLDGVSFELSETELEQFRQFDRLPANVEARIGRDHGRNDRIIARIAGPPARVADTGVRRIRRSRGVARCGALRARHHRPGSFFADRPRRPQARNRGVQKERYPGAHQLRSPHHRLRCTEDTGRGSSPGRYTALGSISRWWGEDCVGRRTVARTLA